MTSLQDLQSIIERGDKKSADKFKFGEVLEEEDENDVFGTLSFASDPLRAKEKTTILNVDELLIEGVEESRFGIVALALRHKANPNLYVTVNTTNTLEEPETEADISIMHIIAYAWRIYLERDGNLELMLAIVSLLCAAGSNVLLPVVERDELLKRRRKMALRPAAVSSIDVLETIGEPRTVQAYIYDTENTGDRGILGQPNQSAYEDFPRGLFEENAYYSNDVTLKYIAIFTSFRDALGEVKFITRTGTFTAGDLRITVPMSDEDHDAAADLAIMIGEGLDDISHIPNLKDIEDTDLKLETLMYVHANTCGKLLLVEGLVSSKGMELAFEEAIRSYNYRGVRLLLENGFRSRYNHVDRIIFEAAQKHSEELPVSTKILNGILIVMSELGCSFDHEQLGAVGTFSESTFLRLTNLEAVPYWKRSCSAPNGFVRSDLRALARELDLDPELDKASLCEEFGRIAETDMVTLDVVSRRLQTTKRRAYETSVADLVTEESDVQGVGDKGPPARGKSSTRNPPRVELPTKPIKNVAQLTRDPSTYSRLDLHCVEDRSSGFTYCFEAIDYPTVLRTKVNKYTGNRLTTAEIEAIRGKYLTLIKLELPLESSGIETAIAKLKGKTSKDDYELWVRARRDRFLRIITDDLFVNEPEDGGLEIEQMETLINDVVERDDIVLTPSNNREYALRTFALTFLEYVDVIRSMPDEEDRDIELADLFGRLMDGTSIFLRR
uniref:Uncharacterized protein n=1 Tax=viral metagenome TaxID=1070528 RepID=A0A6C0CI88_9ZZZZ